MQIRNSGNANITCILSHERQVCEKNKIKLDKISFLKNRHNIRTAGLKLASSYRSKQKEKKGSSKLTHMSILQPVASHNEHLSFLPFSYLNHLFLSHCSTSSSKLFSSTSTVLSKRCNLSKIM